MATALFLGLGLAAFPAQKKVKPDSLSKTYQDWLKLTDYIIRDKERDVFLSLASDLERDAFIEAFWKVRDPTPGTPANEYKDEIIKRFNEANKKFRRTSVREGWKTDQGRFWIILGPPASVEQLPGNDEIWPCEIWSYYGDVSKGMPIHFSLVFYQKGGVGEPKLYDPVSDGPLSLMIKARQEMSPTDYEGMYWRIYELYPDLASVCLSIIPGEIPYAYHPSPQNTIFLASIVESPKKLVNESYATHFLDYKGVVSTDYLTNYMESTSNVTIVHDSLTGLTFCDFAMAPERLSVDFYEPKDEYNCNFQVDVSLRLGEKIILQYSKDFPMAIPAASMADTQAMGVCIADSFPVVEGKYHLTVLLRNTVGKEFSILERDIEIPFESGLPRLSAPVLGYKIAEVQPGIHVPYQAGDKKINIDPKNLYSASDQIVLSFSILGFSEELRKGGRVEILIRGAKPNAPSLKSLSVPLNTQAFRRLPNFVGQVAAAELEPDYYDMRLTLKDAEGKTLDERTANFVLAAKKGLAHPVIAAKTSSLANSFILYYMLAHQYDRLNENEKAEAAYKKAFNLNREYIQKVPEYADFLLRRNKIEEALGLIEAIQGDPKLKFQYFLLKGRALMGLGRYAEAVGSLVEGNRIYNSDSGLLYALGYCYFKTGEVQTALNVLNASLKLNPNQEDVKKLIKTIEEQKK